MTKEGVKIRLERVSNSLSALETALMYVSVGLDNFLEEEKKDIDIDSIIYGKETIDGVVELLGSIKSELYTLSEQVIENKELI